MNQDKLQFMHEGKGFIAALDQSGGSTPKALKLYGIDESQYKTEDEMFDLIHAMRARIMQSPAFTKEHILGAILFEKTLHKNVAGMPTTEYLGKKGILPILKVDKGLADLGDGVQLMKPMPSLGPLLDEAVKMGVFGTKMRSVIKDANAAGIKRIVAQQFEVGREILGHDLVPILEPEVDIRSADRRESEAILLEEVKKELAKLPTGARIMFKFSIPVQDNLYSELLRDPHVLRIVALSGGYTRAEANAHLARNHGLIASFSRALTEGLNAKQSDEEFNAVLSEAILSICKASAT